jgi:hypothetical protein
MSATVDARLTDSLENAQKLQKTLQNADLYIVKSQASFDSRTTTDDETLRLPLTFADSGGPVDPLAVSADVKAQLVCASLLLTPSINTLSGVLS